MLEQKIDRLNISIENLNLKIDELINVFGGQSEQAQKINGKTPPKQDNEPKTETKSTSKAKPKPVADDAPPPLSLEDVRELLKDVSKAEGKPTALEIMKEHASGATTMQQINEAHYQAVYDACQAILQKQAA